MNLDLGLTEYILLTFITAIGFILFAREWWIEARRPYGEHPDPMYMYVTFMIFGVGYSNIIEGINRWLRMSGNLEASVKMYDSWLWETRNTVTLICIAAIVIHWIYRRRRR